MECSICYTTESGIDYLTCCDKVCNVQICRSCMKAYVKHIDAESLLPKCIGSTCDAIYVYRDIRDLGDKAVGRYVDACYKATLRKDKGKIDDRIRTKQVLAALRKEKSKYIEDHFPVAIGIVAQIICKVRLNRLKANQHVEHAKKYGRTCMRLLCDGVLDEDLQCTKCMTAFCKQCERSMERGKDHVCNQEDVSSLEIAKALPKCPKCGIHVDKDGGCDHVRCGVCGTKFCYRSGELGGGGGHTVMVENIRVRKLLSTEYRNKLSSEVLQLVILTESKEMKVPSHETVNNIMRDLVEGKHDDRKKLAKAIDRYYSRKYAYKRYIQIMDEIERMIVDGAITVDIMKMMIASL